MIRIVTSLTPLDEPVCRYHRLREDVVLVVAKDGSGRLLDLSGEVLAISQSGVRMLECALSQDIEDASRTLSRAYRIDEARMQSDFFAFLASLNERHLLIRPGAEVATASTMAATLSWLMAPFILVCKVKPRLIFAKAHLLLLTAFVSIRLFGWANAIRVWHCAAGPSPYKAAGDAHDMFDIIDQVVARTVATFPFNVSCKERALACHLLLRAAGAESRIIIGVDLLPFAMHCWCESKTRVLADHPGSNERFTPVLIYG